MLNSTHLKPVKKKTPLGDKILDRMVTVVSVAYPLSAVPQLIQIIHGNSAGVSVTSWLSFFTCAGLFLIYGLRHRVSPMIISNSIWVVVDGLVVISLLLSRA